jgi:Fic family protein
MNQISQIIADYQAAKLDEVIDHERFNQYAIVHHSSSIEGSTLTENETRLLLEENLTPKGKPLEHSLMVRDHYEALQLVLEAAKKKQVPDVAFIQSINAKVMRHTGTVYQTVFGELDATKGVFRKGNVSAGGSYFVNFDKVENYTQQLTGSLKENLSKATTVEGQLKLSFAAHFDLVSIHPFYDGNGRTSRLLMNFVQAYFQLPLGIVYKEDKADYFTALQEARKKEDTEIFQQFMIGQYKKFLELDLQQFKKDMKQPLLPKKHTRNSKGKGLGFSIFY